MKDGPAKPVNRPVDGSTLEHAEGWRKLRTCVVAVACAAIAQSAPAQTPQEAAAANVQIAMTLCLQNYRTPENLLPAFAAAGFKYTPEDFGDGTVLHWYAAPENTALVMVRLEQGSGFCAINTNHMGVAQALPFAKQVLDILAPGQFSPGSLENENILPGQPEADREPCSGFSGLLPQRAIWVQVASAGNDPRCVEDGTSQIMMTM